MNTYDWNIQGPPMVSPSLDGLTNVVVSADWCVTATSDQMETVQMDNGPVEKPITAYRYGGPVALGAPSPAAFTPFEDTTLADVIGWYKDAMGKEEVDGIIKSLDAEIAAKIAAAADPSTPRPMPLPVLESN